MTSSWRSHSDKHGLREDKLCNDHTTDKKVGKSFKSITMASSDQASTTGVIKNRQDHAIT